MRKQRVRVDRAGAQDNSRIAAISLAVFTLRFMEQWKHTVADYDRAMILVSVVAIRSERLLRDDLPTELRSLATALDPERLGTCNVSSIASATGLNRETTRRKVASLVKEGLLVREKDGSFNFVPGRLQKSDIGELIGRQLDTVVRLINDLDRLGVVSIGA